MKKIIFILFVIALVILTPKLISYPVESRYLDYLQKLDSNPYLTVTDISYEANWFHSSVSYKMEINSFDLEESMAVKVTEFLRHGPVIFDEQLHFGLAYSNAHLDFIGFEFTPDQIESFNDVVTIRSLISYSGDAASTIDMKAFSFTEEQATIEIKPAQAQINLSADGLNVDGTSTWQGMELRAGNDGEFTFGEMSLTFDAKIVSGSLFDGSALSVGNSKFSMENMVFSEPNMALPIRIEDFNTTVVNTIDQGLLNTVMTTKLAKLELMAEQLQQITMTMHIDNLSAKAMTEFNQLSVQVQQSAAADSEQEVDMTPFKALLPEILKHKPQIKISELSAQVSEGELYADLLFTIDEEKFDINNMMSMARAMTIDANLKAPVAYLAKMGMTPMIQAYQQQQMLTIDNDYVVTRFQYINGLTLMNEKALPFSQL